MTGTTNQLESFENPLQLKFGSYDLQQSVDNPPTLTVVKYFELLKDLPELDTEISYGGYTFYLASLQYKESPPLKTVGNNSIRYQASLTYAHHSQKLLSKTINTADFIRQYGRLGLKVGQDFYRFEINVLIASFLTYAGFNKSLSISGLSGYVNLPFFPSNRESFGIKSFLDDRALINNRVAVYTQRGIQYIPLGSGSFLTDDPLGEVAVVKNEVPPYKKTLMNWSGDQNYTLQNRYVAISDDEYLTYEGSLNPHLPPQEAILPNKAPRDLSVMTDNSGFSKDFKLTKYKYGQPEAEISGVYGFAHAALELISDPLMPHASQTQDFIDRLIKNPLQDDNAFQKIFQDLTNESMGFSGADVFARPMKWRIVSVKQTEYVYESLKLNIEPRVIDFNGNYVNVQLPEEYDEFLTSSIQVLTKEVTTGWELKRFANEDVREWAKGSIDQYLRIKTALELGNVVQNQTSATAIKFWHLSLYRAKVGLENYLYRKIPIWEEVRYAIRPFSRYYKEGDKVDWKIENIPKAQVPGYDGQLDPVPVLFPDPNWQPNLMIVARSRYKVSVGVAGNPDYNPFAIKFFNTNPLVVTTGSEEFEFTKYSILPSKSTKAAISELQTEVCDIQGLLTSINTNQSYPGTYYQPFEYMQPGDYGIIGQAQVPNIDAGLVIPQGTKDDPSGDNTSAFRVRDDSSVKDDQYQVTRSFRTATDAGFKSNVLNSTFSLEQGRPPSATLRKPLFELDPNQLDNGLKDTLTFITSNVTNTSTTRIKDEISITGAQNLQEALDAAKFLLANEIFNSGSTISTTFKWGTNPKPNAKFSFSGSDFAVKSSTRTISIYDGLAFSEPLAVELGEIVPINISSQNTTVTSDSTIQNGLIITIDPVGLPSQLGTVVENVPEDFGRYVDGTGSGLSIT